MLDVAVFVRDIARLVKWLGPKCRLAVIAYYFNICKVGLSNGWARFLSHVLGEKLPSCRQINL